MTNSNVGGNDHNSRIVIAALYKFVPLADCPELREQLLQRCSDAGIKGSLLLASEGINGTIAGTREGIDAVLGWLRLDPRFADISHKESYADDPPFKRMKVKLKREIVTMGFPGITEAGPGGEHADWRTWNALVRDPDVVVVDTRNQYEFDVGTFAGA
ncbi:MAG: hypothetical protein KDH18_25490, partial [Rhodoferax sp.]|nr:hypothetical protein [Rhodoferax sp.]